MLSCFCLIFTCFRVSVYFFFLSCFGSARCYIERSCGKGGKNLGKSILLQPPHFCASLARDTRPTKEISVFLSFSLSFFSSSGANFLPPRGAEKTDFLTSLLSLVLATWRRKTSFDCWSFTAILAVLATAAFWRDGAVAP